MAKDNGPWDDNGENPWQESPQPDKVVKFHVKKKKNQFEISYRLIILIFAALWLASGFYQVQTGEQGIVLRFGRYIDSTEAGLHYRLPAPIETVEKVAMTQERSINLGVSGNSRAASPSLVFTESHMLTGDENIVDINLTVVWRVKNGKDYLFSMRNPDQTVKVAAQSVLREIVGQSEMMPIISGNRGQVEEDTKLELQKVLDDFQSGVEIVRVKLQKADPPKQVVDAFNEVQRAKADMERFKNEAEAYRNEVVPNAHGRASQILQSAEAYKEAVVNQAKGESKRFDSVYQAYKQGKLVTAKRLYIETMEEVLSKSNKIILDPSAKGANVLPYLPLDGFKKDQRS